ncbi:unnamed protein product [Prorocentrum cordatum]|uniref:Uncharacterized protein n=1 Tax=Prorocentrum cordatum TaxID=2364126 RepID=A0ABN9PR77_9DINO|nr:unnamed protein product [Polarella glacialis]
MTSEDVDDVGDVEAEAVGFMLEVVMVVVEVVAVEARAGGGGGGGEVLLQRVRRRELVRDGLITATRRTSTLACWPSTTPAALASAASRSRRAVPAAPSRSPCPRNGLCWCVCVCVCVCLPPLFFPPSVLVGAPLRGRGTVALLGHWHLAQQGQVPALAGPSFPSHSFSFAALPADFLSGPG